MRNLIRFYNQNRLTIWITIFAIIFIFAVIRAFNNLAGEEIKRKAQERQNNINNEVAYHNESKSMVTGGNVSDTYRESFGNVLNNFLNYCVQGKTSEAYNLLSSTCKEVMYPTEEYFEKQYRSKNFEEGSTFSFQAWTSSTTYIYRVKIFKNLLSSGNADNSGFIQDYISIVEENNEYKLNISSYIGRVNKNKQVEQNGIIINLQYIDIFMDYEKHTYLISNNTQNKILLDTRENTGTIYLLDENQTKFDSMLYETPRSDLYINPNTQKDVTIKFSNSFRDGIETESVIFSDIVDNADLYEQNKNNYSNRINVQIDV